MIRPQFITLSVRILLGIGLIGVPVGSGAASDEWIGRATNAATALVRGDAGSAAVQAIPGANIQLAKLTRLYVNPSGVGLQQNLIPVKGLDNRYLNVSSTYNAGTALNLNQRPTLSQNVQVSAGNQFLTNTTTLAPQFKRKN